MERKRIITSLILSLLFNSLLFLYIFEPLCVKTISNSYLDEYISNKIIDLLIDENINLSSSQLELIKDDIIESKSLYNMNKEGLHEVIYHSNIHSIKYRDEFVDECILIIDEHCNYTIDKQVLIQLIEDNNYWMKLNKYISRNIHPIVIYMYQFVQSIYLKIILMICIAVFMYKTMYYHSIKLYSVVFYSTALLHLGALCLLQLSKPLLLNILSIKTLQFPIIVPTSIATLSFLFGSLLYYTHSKTS